MCSKREVKKLNGGETNENKNICSLPPRWRIHIGFLRIPACFLVLVNHTAESLFRDRAPSATWLCGVLYFFVCRIAVPIFLLIMGAVLLDKTDTPKRSVIRFIRIFIVMAIGSACYVFFYNVQGAETSFDVKIFFPNLLKFHVTNAFWYLYLYLALLCLLPILQKLVKALSKWQIGYVLFLSLGVLGILPSIKIFFPSFQVSRNFTMALFSPYIGMLLLGYFIEHYVPNTTKSFSWAFCGFVLLIVFQTAVTFLLYQRDPSSYYSAVVDLLAERTLLTVTSSSACFYICIRYIITRYPPCPRMERIIHSISDLTFGIYLLGDMLITLSRPIYTALCGHCHVIVAMLLWEILIFVMGAFITAGLRAVPPLRKWL